MTLITRMIAIYSCRASGFFARTLMTLAVIGFSAAATAAGSVSGALITGLFVNTADNMVFIQVNLSKSTNPSCSTSGYAFVLPLTTTLDGQTLALLLSARTSQTTVTLTGNGMCDTYSNVETLQTILY